MQKFEILRGLHAFLLISNLLITVSMAQHVPTSLCGKIQIKKPFFSPNSTVNRMILCESQKLYFRTSLGLFPVSSIDYRSKTLIISHPSSSSSRKYVSPSRLSAGFPSPPYANSLLLFNCSIKKHPMSQFMSNCTHLHIHGAASGIQEKELKVPYSCLLIDDHPDKLDMNFHPKDWNCSHYRRVYRRSLDDVDYNEVELGTRISFDIPNADHVPDICNECEKPNGNCGVGLRCLCHAKECKDKIISLGGSLNPGGNILFSLLCFTVVMVFWRHY